ncbi:HD domain-containing protein [Haliangium ochraceum]|uniref:Metal dependent phosphohydrolase n=1 Tax=Haliangium ochraceum (strain DSM 14365 / JCM 11303 / SMP-2) TaxID=502025 RepID=D0LXV4_HALO1|nr:HD domain-containing protein [Haliangium ochraceum]ACY14309.1 metal dependent phosphohydrolase [Haliangium ochraceum DSM 14365]
MSTPMFTRLDQSTAEDWKRIDALAARDQDRTLNKVLTLLRELEHVNNGFAVDQLVHSLQTATRAERAGADEEMIAAALVHDVGKVISTANHGEIASSMLRPFVRDEVRWVIEVHQHFEGQHYYQHFGLDPNIRDKFRDHPAFEMAARFADEWDQVSFDPEYDTLPLAHFEPLVCDIFGRPPQML